MPVYVDDMEAPFRNMVMCHMMADTTEELLEMADKISVQRKWIQHPGTYSEHFDIAKTKRALAVKHGAEEITLHAMGMYQIGKRVRMQMKELRALKGQQIWDFVRNRGLVTAETDAAKVKSYLIQWVRFKCIHPHTWKLYDLMACLCPNCDELLEYHFDTDRNRCINECGFEAPPEESGSMDTSEMFDWLDACIGCKDCEYQGNPADLTNPFSEAAGMDVTW